MRQIEFMHLVAYILPQTETKCGESWHLLKRKVLLSEGEKDEIKLGEVEER